jgi:succinate dehydrogenase/fumarate reductase flavoprotein subunit
MVPVGFLTDIEEEIRIMRISRRHFIEGTAAAVLTQIPLAEAKEAGQSFDRTCDVLVVGGGFAGLTAAVTAARAGAKVIVIDKRYWVGGDGLLSAGQFYTARTPYHDKAGITKNVEVEDYWKQICSGVDDEPLSKVRDNLRLSVIYSGVNKHNPEVLHKSAEYSPKVVDFVASYGIEFMPMNPAKPFQLPTVNGSMSKFVKGMVKELDERKVPILKGLRAKEILTRGNRVVGIEAEWVGGENKGKAVTLGAPSVVISTGGFLNSDYLMKRYKRFWTKAPTGFTAIGEGVPEDHTGDGIIMGKKIGAAVEDMESMPKFYAAPKKGTPGISWIMFDVDTAYLVGPNGKRFTNEHQSRYSGCALKMMSGNIDGGYVIFDEQTFRGGNRGRWRFDDALKGKGLFKGNTPEELAKAVGIDAKGLRETMERINKDAANGGKDTEFGRDDRLFRALKAPYYITAPSYPVRYKTEGGLEVNPDFVVIRASDESPIEGLYAAGSTCGSISSRLCDVVASGLIVGGTASAHAKKHPL